MGTLGTGHGPRAQARPRWKRPVHVLLALVCAAFAVMWAFALFINDPQPAGVLDDVSWPPRAQAVCARARAEVDALPPAHTAHTPQERAVVLDRANDTLAAMVADLRALGLPASGRDASFVQQWLADWDGYVASRRAHADALRAGDDGEFSVADAGGEPVTERMDFWARVNDMPACVVPLDV